MSPHLPFLSGVPIQASTSQPDLESLMKIAKLLEVELTDLVRFKEFKNNIAE